jgi:hypothetical protein
MSITDGHLASGPTPPYDSHGRAGGPIDALPALRG